MVPPIGPLDQLPDASPPYAVITPKVEGVPLLPGGPGYAGPTPPPAPTEYDTEPPGVTG